jgi:hypothetical protein
MSRSVADIRIIPARRAHIRTVARRMRQADRDEVFASSRKSPREALEFSLSKSAEAWTVTVNGRPEVMFGVGDLNILAGVGAPWLLGTEAFEKHSVAMLRGSKKWTRQLFGRYSILRNFVDARNTASLRYLRWLGFKLFDPVEMGGHEFHLFELRSTGAEDGSRCDRALSG